MTRRADVNFEYILPKNITVNNTGKGLLQFVNVYCDLQS